MEVMRPVPRTVAFFSSDARDQAQHATSETRDQARHGAIDSSMRLGLERCSFCEAVEIHLLTASVLVSVHDGEWCAFDVQLGSQVSSFSLSRVGGLTDGVFAGPSDVQKQKCFKPVEVSDGPIQCRVTYDRGGYRGSPNR